VSEATRFEVSGRVQGVGYRAFCLREATRLGLIGYARNQADGTVVTVVMGPGPAVEAYRTQLERGPAFARVDTVRESRISVEEGRLKGFDIG